MEYRSSVSNFLILGSTGFVGSALQNQLTQSVYENVVGASSGLHNKSGRKTSLNSMSHVVWDITKRSELPANFDVIVHAATPASAVLNSQNPDEMFRIITRGMENVIEFASRHPKAPTILFTSSGAVYGTQLNYLDSVREDSQILLDSNGPTSAYADGKRAAESLLDAATKAGACRGLIARLFAFSGINLPRDRHFAIGNFVEDAVVNKKITVRSDGSSIRSYLDEQDMAQWLLAIAQNGNPDRIYHIGSERAVSIRELAFLVAERCTLITGEQISVDILGQISSIDGVSRYVPSTVRTRQELGLSETISLESSIDSMLRVAISEQV